MIDFNNATFIKLNPWDLASAQKDLQQILHPDEQIYLAFKGMRDSVTFTSKRIIALNVQGMTGKKKDYTTLPYSKIQAYSVETAGTLDLDSEAHPVVLRARESQARLRARGRHLHDQPTAGRQGALTGDGAGPHSARGPALLPRL